MGATVVRRQLGQGGRHPRTRPSVVRSAASLTGVSIALVAVCRTLRWATGDTVAQVAAPGPASFDAVLALAAAVAVWCLFGWLAATLLVALVAAVTRGLDGLTRSSTFTSTASRRLAALVLGLTLMPPAALPAYAAELSPGIRTSAVVATSTTVDPAGAAAPVEPAQRSGGDEPAPATAVELDRPAGGTAVAVPQCSLPGESERPISAPDATIHREPRAATAMLPSPHHHRAGVNHVVVRRGDTLWDLVARHLGARASNADVAAEWPRWYAANRATVGADPDLIHPGQLLRVPPTSHTSRPNPETP